MCVIMVDLGDTSNLFTFDGFGSTRGVGTTSFNSAIIETWDWVGVKIAGMVGVVFEVFASRDTTFDSLGIKTCDWARGGLTTSMGIRSVPIVVDTARGGTSWVVFFAMRASSLLELLGKGYYNYHCECL
jgi:hypothetical protein